jgi:predicted GNAT family acetyltransferase
MEKLRQQLLAASIQSMFLKRLSQDQKEYCKLRHEAEMKMICQLLRDSGQNMMKIKILDAYSIGLIAKKRESYVKDSINFLVVVKENGTRKVLGVEMKARVTGATQQAFLQHAQQRIIDDSSGTPNVQQNKYVMVDAIHHSSKLGKIC